MLKEITVISKEVAVIFLCAPYAEIYSENIAVLFEKEKINPLLQKSKCYLTTFQRNLVAFFVVKCYNLCRRMCYIYVK